MADSIPHKWINGSESARLNEFRPRSGKSNQKIHRHGIGKSHHFKSGGVSIKPEQIIISGDMLAADWVAANLLAEFYDGFQVEMARPHLEHAAKIGLGVAGLDDVVIKEGTV